MQKVSHIALMFCLVSLASGCVIGRVMKTNGTPLAGALVSLRQCEMCPPWYLVTDEDGYYAYDYYAISGSHPAFIETEDGIIVKVFPKSWRTYLGGPNAICHRTGGVEISHRTIYQTYAVTNEDYTIVPDVWLQEFTRTIPESDSCGDPTVSALLDLDQIAADIDNDGLAMIEEIIAGTDQFNADTDFDGLSDGLEVYGMHPEGNPVARSWGLGTDIRSRGASPRRKDTFVEIDYHEAPIAGGGTATAYPGVALRNAVADFYEALAGISNPDGSLGLNVVMVPDVGINLDFKDCDVEFSDTSNMQPRRDGIYTHGLYCIRGREFGTNFEGLAQGAMFHVTSHLFNTDPTDDLDELWVYRFYWLTLHEFGHTLGIDHGGTDSINCKPNYPSNVNYAYDRSFNVDNPTTNESLANNELQYSTGELEALNEEWVWEVTPLSGSISDLSFIRYYGESFQQGYSLVVNPNDPTRTDIDWDRSGGFSAGAEDISQEVIQDLILRDAAAGLECGVEGPDDQPTQLFDSDDTAIILANLDSRPAVSESAGEPATQCSMDEEEESAQSAKGIAGMEGSMSGSALEAISAIEETRGGGGALQAILLEPKLSQETKAILIENAKHSMASKSFLHSLQLPSDTAESRLVEAIEHRILRDFNLDVRLGFVDCPASEDGLRARAETISAMESSLLRDPDRTFSASQLSQVNTARARDWVSKRKEISLCR